MYKAAHLYWEQGVIIPQVTMVTTTGRRELHAKEANKNGYYKYEVLSVKIELKTGIEIMSFLCQT